MSVTEFPRTMEITDSTMVSRIAYHPQKRLLRVWFKQTNSVWDYADIWPTEFSALVSAYSIGEYFNVYIRPTHEGERVSPAPGHRAKPTKKMAQHSD